MGKRATRKPGSGRSDPPVRVRGPNWSAEMLYKVKRKWQAGRTLAQIRKETGFGARKTSQVCAQLAAEAGSAPAGGGYKKARVRREDTAVLAVALCVPTRKGGRRRPGNLSEVNAAVRKIRAYRETAVRTTSTDLKAAGGRRVLRCRAVVAQRQEMLGDGGADVAVASQEAVECVRKRNRV